MIRVGLVDDHKYDLEKLNAVVTQDKEVEVIFSTQDAEEAYEYVKRGKVDLLIADIEMPKLSGYELADLIHSHALDVAVLFVTAHSGYAVHAFELNVHDYIMKPFRSERLLHSLDRYRQKNFSVGEHGNLVIKQKSEIHFIRKKEILFVERTGRSTTIVTRSEEFETYQPLHELEKELPERDFIRAHRSYIINIHFVKNFSLYSRNTYTVTFHNSTKKAYITKNKLEEFQHKYF